MEDIIDPLVFKRVKSADEIQKVYNFNVEVFSDGLGFDWSLDNLKKEMKKGWEVYAAQLGDEIIAVIFQKLEDESLLTKHSQVKMEKRGHGLSHRIKEYLENIGKENNCKNIIHICEVDDFRMISLNETHGYKKTGRKLSKITLTEWAKKL